VYVEIVMGEAGQAEGTLCEVFDLKRFSVRVGAGCSEEAVTDWLTAADAGHRIGDDVAVSLHWLQQHTATRTPEWQADFQRMLDYASTRGWMDDARTVVTAHVEKVRG
jgi:hypothetical protein